MKVFACACGKNLKIADEMSGKKVKCPGCGQVAVVPVKVAAGPVNMEASTPPSPPSVSAVGKRPPVAAASGNDATLALAPSPSQETGVNDPRTLRGAEADGELTSLGGYRIIRKLGQGGMGAVYEAEDAKLERRLALKVMKPEIAKNEQHRFRFLREARTAAKVESDFICPIYQVGEENGVPFIAMPFLKGESLDAPLKKGVRLPINEIVRLSKEVAEGLSAAHEAGLIHRDIKPANIWLETQRNGPPRARILDFGLARAQADDVQITQSGAILGTPAYMSPEQARGQKDVDARTDLFSLGCMMYALCTGVLPFKGETTISILMALAVRDPVPPHEISETPESLSNLIMRLLAKDPDNRIQTAKDLIEELVTIESELPKIAKTTSGSRTMLTPPSATKTPTQVKERPARQTELIGAARSPKPKGPRVKPLAIAAVALLLFIGGGFAAYQFLFTTKDGTLIVEVDGDADVRFQRGKLLIHDADGKLQYTLKPSEKNKTLPRGTYKVEVVGADGLKLDTDRFEIVRDGKATVRVTVDSSAVAMKSEKVNRTSPLSADHTLVFDGKTSHISLPTLVAEDGPFTMEGWFTLANKNNMSLLSIPHKNGSGMFRLTVDGNNPQTVLVRATKQAIGASTGPGLPVGATFHLAVVFHGDEKWTHWVNGKKVIERKDRWAWPVPVSNRFPAIAGSDRGVPVGAGQTVDAKGQDRPAFEGVMRELRVSNSARYSADFTPAKRFETDKDTLALYHFDEGQGDVLKDSSGNGRHGKIVGAKWVKADGTSVDGLPSSEFVPLFNGKDLAGWTIKGHPGWSVKDGSLIGDSSGPIGWLMSDKEYADFELSLDYKQSAGGNSGIFLRAWPEGTVNGAHFMEVQLLDDVITKEPKTRTGAIFGLVAPNPLPKATLNEWHRVDIRAVGRQVQITFDNQKIVSANLDDYKNSFDRFPGLTKATGRIGLQLYPGKIEFKYIRVRQLAPLTPPPLGKAPFNAKEARAHQEAWAKYLGTTVETTNRFGMKMVLVAPGEFMMGSTPENAKEAGGLKTFPAELPRHRVVLTKAFLCGSTEVTLGSFKKFVDATKYVTDKEREIEVKKKMGLMPQQRYWRVSDQATADDMPVTHISWNDAIAFCNWLSDEEMLPRAYVSEAAGTWNSVPGPGYRLPSEAQWEYACRAGTSTIWFGGDLREDVQPYGWFSSNTKTLHPTGSKLPNAFGLFDMHGNVEEWCDDWFDENWYANSPVENPEGPTKGDARAVRGGFYWGPESVARSAFRGPRLPATGEGHSGFRVVRVLSTPTASISSTDPDRKAAEWVLSIGGTVNVNGEERVIKAASDLPHETFRLTMFKLLANKLVSDAGLAIFRDCKYLKDINLEKTVVSDVGLAYFKNCKILQAIWLGITKVRDAGLAHFIDSKNLMFLGLGRMNVSNAGLDNFKNCTSVEYLP